MCPDHVVVLFFFFFQAEDGIRDLIVTGFRRVLFRSSFSWVATRRGASQRDLEVAVSVRGGHTRIAIRENLASLIGGIYGGIGGGMGGGGIRAGEGWGGEGGRARGSAGR